MTSRSAALTASRRTPILRPSVVIATRSRKQDLRKAIASALKQTVSIELVVIDDGSTDGSAEMVKAEFPQVHLVHHANSLGYVVRRNEGARMATGDVVFSIDDDAEFGTADTVEKTLREFDHPRVGAVAIPHIDTLEGKIVNFPSPLDGQVRCVASFTGTAYAVRRNVFLKLGGYREHLVHQGEELDFCIRLLGAGFITRLGSAPLIEHHESPRRSLSRMDFHGRRNDILFVWHNVPVVYLPAHMAFTLLNGLRCAVKTRRFRNMFCGMAHGLMDCLSWWRARSPVSPAIYRLFRRLKWEGPLRLNEIEPLLCRPPTWSPLTSSTED